MDLIFNILLDIAFEIRYHDDAMSFYLMSCRHKSLVSALIMFMVMLCTTSPLVWHSDNLTFCHALYQNNTPSPHWMYPSYLLSYPLCLASKIFPFLNVYLLYLYGLLIGCATAVLHVSRSQGNGLGSSVGQAGLLFACYIIFFIPQHIEYPWISFLAGGCGCMLVFHSLYQERPSAKELLSGAALFFGGILLRHDSCLGCAPFIGVATLFLLKPASGVRHWVNLNGRRLVVPILCLCGIAFVSLVQYYPAQRSYRGGNLIHLHTVRMNFYDYSDRSGIDKRREYDAAGIDQASVELLQGHLFEDAAVQTPDWWERAGRIRVKNNPRSAIFKRDTVAYIIDRFLRWGYHFLVFTLIALWSTSNRRGIGKIYPLAMLAAFYFGIFVCCIRLRCHETPIMSLSYFYLPMLLVGYKPALPPAGKALIKRVCFFASAFLAMLAIMLLGGKVHVFYLLIALFLVVTYPWAGCTRRQMKMGHILASGWLVSVFLLYFFTEYQSHISLFGGFRQTYSSHGAEHDSLVRYATGHPKLIFLCNAQAYRALAYPSSALISPRAPYVCNIIEWGDWKTMLPHRLLQREKLGIRNEVLCVLDERMRFVLRNNERVESLVRYLRDHYGISVEFVEEYRLGEEYAVYRALVSGGSPSLPHVPAPRGGEALLDG